MSFERSKCEAREYLRFCRDLYLGWKSRYMRDCFVIASAGSAATRWLAASLNLHPDITCSGGGGELKDIMDFSRAPDAAETERIAEFNLRHFASSAGRPKMLSQIFAELKAYRPAKIYGNVHLFSVTSLLHHLTLEPLPTTFPFANVVRHPVGRLETHFRVSMMNYNTGPSSKELIEYVTNQRVTVDRAYLDLIYSAEHLKVGRFSGRSQKSEAEYWLEWTDWQRDMFLEADSQLGLTGPYRRMGYDFSFL